MGALFSLGAYSTTGSSPEDSPPSPWKDGNWSTWTMSWGEGRIPNNKQGSCRSSHPWSSSTLCPSSLEWFGHLINTYLDFSEHNPADANGEKMAYGPMRPTPLPAATLSNLGQFSYCLSFEMRCACPELTSISADSNHSLQRSQWSSPGQHQLLMVRIKQREMSLTHSSQQSRAQSVVWHWNLVLLSLCQHKPLAFKFAGPISSLALVLQKTDPPHAVATAEIRDGAGPTSKETPANATQAGGLWVSQTPFRENKNRQTNPIKKNKNTHHQNRPYS